MPYKGRMPKPDDERVNRNPRMTDPITVSPHEGLLGPDLPEDVNWCDRTIEWWNVWRNSPQASLMTPTDWETMFENALMHNEIWRPRKTPMSLNAMKELLAELRRRVGQFGATHEDRIKLRISISSPHEEAQAEAQLENDAEEMLDYVEKLTQVVASKKQSRP